MVGNGQTLDITHVGNTKVETDSSPIHLKNVLLAPEIKKDLLSVSQLPSEFPYIFAFNCDGFMIKDRSHTK